MDTKEQRIAPQRMGFLTLELGKELATADNHTYLPNQDAWKLDH